MGDQVNLIYGVLVLDLGLRARVAQKQRVSHSSRLAFWLRVYSSNRIRTRNVAVLKLGLAIRPADPLLARWLLGREPCACSRFASATSCAYDLALSMGFLFRSLTLSPERKTSKLVDHLGLAAA
jgi:hypothetical protein